MGNVYKLDVTEEQLRLVHNALEEYFRLRLGQFWDISDELAFIGFDYANHTNEEFNDRINKRDEFRDLCETWFRNSHNSVELSKLKTSEVNNAIDMWHVIEHQQWKDREGNSMDRAAYPPFQTGTEPLMRIEVNNEDNV